MKLKYLALVLLAVVVFFGAYMLAKPKDSVQPKTSTTESTIKEYVIEVKGKKLVAGPETISAKQGDTVTIRITNDEDEELHVHGYDQSVQLKRNKQTSITIFADKSGNFPYELEGSKTDLGMLQVQP